MNLVHINSVDVNVLGQMEWFDLIDEILVQSLIVPLYSLLKGNKSGGKCGMAFVLSFGIYFAFTGFISLYVSQISDYMNAEYAAEFLKLQAVSLLIMFISTFSILLLTLNNDYKKVILLTVLRLVLLTITDLFFIHAYLDRGAVYSEIVTNSCIAVISLFIVRKRKYLSFGKTECLWLVDYAKMGAFAGMQIFLDNFIYAVMICKMVNAVSESGNYWIANNFIWGWLLLPATCITEIIKKNHIEKLSFRNAGLPGLMIAAFWLVTYPGWKWFLDGPMSSESGVILKILYPLVPFYVTYLVSGFIDAWFISEGKTIYNAITSLIVNIGYYGVAYLLFRLGFFALDIMFVILLFGFGMVVHMLCSVLFYRMEQKKRKRGKQISAICNEKLE